MGKTALGLVLAGGLLLAGCQNAEEPAPRHPLTRPAVPSTAEKIETPEKAALPPPLPPSTAPLEVSPEVVGPKDLVRSKPLRSGGGSSIKAKEAAPKAPAAVPSVRKEPAKGEDPLKSKEKVPSGKEIIKEPFEPWKPPHPMPGA
jgi:hypothetical protein